MLFTGNMNSTFDKPAKPHVNKRVWFIFIILFEFKIGINITGMGSDV